MNMQITNFTYGNTLDLKLSTKMEEKLRKIKLYVDEHTSHHTTDTLDLKLSTLMEEKLRKIKLYVKYV